MRSNLFTSHVCPVVMWIVTHQSKLCVFFLLVIVLLLIHGIPQFWGVGIRSTQSGRESIPLCKDQSKLSIYYQLTKSVKWQFVAHGEEAKNCTLSNSAVCELTDDSTEYDTADVLLIRECGTDVTQPAYPGQLILRYNRAPEHMKCNTVGALPLGDIRVSYTLNSTIPYPYICWPDIKQPLIDVLRLDPPVGRHGVAMFVSHCVKWRDKYISQLMKYIHIDSYGKCLHNTITNHSRNVGSASFISIKLDTIKSKEYKFLITFENSLTRPEYISEKIWHAYLAQAIPIYYGNNDMIYNQVPGANSFINAKKYRPKELATFIKKIDQDESLYRSFFKFDIQRTLNFQKNCPTELLGCSMCKELYQLKQQRCGRKNISVSIHTNN